jgi:hypothetical protein
VPTAPPRCGVSLMLLALASPVAAWALLFMLAVYVVAGGR